MLTDITYIIIHHAPKLSNLPTNMLKADMLGAVPYSSLTLNLPTTTIVAQPCNIIKWQLKFNPVA